MAPFLVTTRIRVARELMGSSSTSTVLSIAAPEIISPCPEVWKDSTRIPMSESVSSVAAFTSSSVWVNVR